MIQISKSVWSNTLGPLKIDSITLNPSFVQYEFCCLAAQHPYPYPFAHSSSIISTAKLTFFTLNFIIREPHHQTNALLAPTAGEKIANWLTTNDPDCLIRIPYRTCNCMTVEQSIITSINYAKQKNHVALYSTIWESNKYNGVRTYTIDYGGRGGDVYLTEILLCISHSNNETYCLQNRCWHPPSIVRVSYNSHNTWPIFKIYRELNGDLEKLSC